MSTLIWNFQIGLTMLCVSPYKELFACELPIEQGRSLIRELRTEFPELKIFGSVLKYYGLNNRKSLPKKIYSSDGGLVFDPTENWDPVTRTYTCRLDKGDKVLVKATPKERENAYGDFYHGQIVFVGSDKGRTQYIIRSPHGLVKRFQSTIQKI